jgi:hypothetical protein
MERGLEVAGRRNDAAGRNNEAARQLLRSGLRSATGNPLG